MALSQRGTCLTHSNNNHRVIVIAASSEGIIALARMINLLSSRFPVPLVAHVHDLRNRSFMRLKGLDSSARLDVMAAVDGDRLLPGHLYVTPSGNNLVFTALGVLGVATDLEPGQRSSSADRLFESAARLYGHNVIGVVLSGNGDDGTLGLRAIYHAGGIGVAQSPSEADFPSMPLNALMRDHVGHLVMLDQMGELLSRLVGELPSRDGLQQGSSAC
jgi:two-component system chemotaxis response regulator CheB